jgi:hypothetical protein
MTWQLATSVQGIQPRSVAAHRKARLYVSFDLSISARLPLLRWLHQGLIEVRTAGARSLVRSALSEDCALMPDVRKGSFIGRTSSRLRTASCALHMCS